MSVRAFLSSAKAATSYASLRNAFVTADHASNTPRVVDRSILARSLAADTSARSLTTLRAVRARANAIHALSAGARHRARRCRAANRSARASRLVNVRLARTARRHVTRRRHASRRSLRARNVSSASCVRLASIDAIAISRHR